jgi:hypothetical protein
VSTTSESAAVTRARELLAAPMPDKSLVAQTAAIPKEPNFNVLLESQNQSLVLSISLLAFGVFVIVAALWRVDRAHLTEAGALRLVGATVVVVMAVFLCTAGFTLEQITPAIGLLGTMGGYLLGRSEKDSANEPPAPAGGAPVPAKPAGDASAGLVAANSDTPVKA